jgi:hypothetical protein
MYGVRRRRTPACHHNRLSDLIPIRIIKAADAEQASRSAFGYLASERSTPAIYSAASKNCVCQSSGRCGRARRAHRAHHAAGRYFGLRAAALTCARRGRLSGRYGREAAVQSFVADVACGVEYDCSTTVCGVSFQLALTIKCTMQSKCVLREHPSPRLSASAGRASSRKESSPMM